MKQLDVKLYIGDEIQKKWKSATQNQGFYCVEGDKKADTKYILDGEQMAVMRNNICMVAPYQAWRDIVKLLDPPTVSDIPLLCDDAADLNGYWKDYDRE